MGILSAYMVPHPPLIVPEIGKGQERAIQETVDAYCQVAKEIAALKPDTVIVISPHSIMYADYFHISPGKKAGGDFGRFDVPEVSMELSYDTEFVQELCAETQKGLLMAGTLGEREKSLDHGTMVPLYFINRLYTDYQLVRIGLSGLSLKEHYRFGTMIKEVCDRLGRQAVVIASGDLSHRLKEDGPYGYRKEGPEYDKNIMEVMGRGDFGKLLEFQDEFCEKAGECGHRSFTIMAGVLDKRKVDANVLSYQGPFGVGYGVCSFHPGASDESRGFLEQYEAQELRKRKQRREEEDAYVRLARHSLETYIREGREIAVPDSVLGELLGQRAGVFVSLKKEGRLRGCIGTIIATTDCVAEEIITNAISAGTRDPRFPPVMEEELEQLVYSVDVLKEAERITSAEELDVKKYGVIVSKGYKRGLLLPNLDGVETAEEQIAIAKEKAGISAEESVMLERFEVVRHF